MRSIFFVLLSAAISSGETAFQNLTPNYDGSAVWFSSSLRMKDTDQYPHPKIFLWDAAGGVRLYDQRAPTITSYTGPTWNSSTAFKLLSISVSADGATVAENGSKDCHVSDVCVVTLEEYGSDIHIAAQGTLSVAGSASLSPNGRFAYLTSSIFPVITAYHDRLKDLLTGQEAAVNGLQSAPTNRHRVANDGTIIVTGSPGIPFSLCLQSGISGAVRQLRSDVFVSQPMISDTGARLLYGVSPNLIAYDVATGRETTVASNLASFVFDMSNDGSLIAYLDSGQVWTTLPDGSGRRQVTSDPDKIVEAALSGNGRVLYAISGISRIIRIDLASGETREIVPSSPLLYPSRPRVTLFPVTPGSVPELTADSLPEIAEVRLLGKTQKILWQDSSGLLIQIPVDMPEGTAWTELVLLKQSEGPFVSSIIWPPIQVVNYAPGWYGLTDRHIAALHDDFSGVVSTANPARPGEYIHVYGTGFGAVLPTPDTGTAALANPLSWLVEPMVCDLEGLSPGHVDVLFAGLAPGFLGLFQFDVRLPMTLGDGDTHLTCRRSTQNPLNGPQASGLLPVRSH